MKKIWAALFLVMTLMVGFTSISGASTDLDKIILMADRTDVLVETLITAAQRQADMAMVTRSGSALDTTLNRTADRLSELTYDAVTRAIIRSDGLIERSWVDVEIGTLTISIDPARVVRY